MQPVLAFNLSGYLLAAVVIVFRIDRRAVGSDTQGYYMYMVPVDVLVFHYKVRHFGKPHLLHILMGNLNILCLTEPVVGMRVEGYVHHSFLCLSCLRHPSLEILENPLNVYSPGAVIVEFIGIKYPAMLLVDLLPVIHQTTV